MSFRLWRLVIACLFVTISAFTFQNCAPVQVTDLNDAASANGIQSVPPVTAKDCPEAGKVDGDMWWVPNGNTRDIMVCAVGTGNQFKIFEEEIEVTCKDGSVVATGNSNRRDTGQVEGMCNLDCGDKKNNETWWNPKGIVNDPIQCTVGTGTQYKEFRNEAEYKCINAVVSETGQTRRVETGNISGVCNLDCGDKKNNELWWTPNGTTKDPVMCTVGTGTQYKVFNEELQYICQNAVKKSTGMTRRIDTGKLEGQCNLDCGEHKNGELWWMANGTSKDAVQCTVGTGTQYRIFNDEVEMKCQNASAVATGQTRRTDSGKLEGMCNLDCGDKKNNQTWWMDAGTSKDAIQCTVGTGTQYKVYTDQNEFICQNAVVKSTGKTQRTATGQIEGTCNLDCGEHKNGELWWMNLPNSTEVKACATSLSATSTITYKNSAEYKCANASTSATGQTKKEVLSETGCPPLTFNNQDNIATVAYEDIYPAAGDSDYNDFVANIKVQETYNSLEQLTKIQIEYTPRLKLAGYAAQFVLVFDGQVRGREGFVSNVKDFKSLPMFEGNATIKVENFDSAGKLISSANNLPKDQDLVIFNNTTTAVSQKPKSVITITGFDPTLNTLALRKGLSIQRYRTVLFVTAEGGRRYDIDLSDINPTMFDSRLQPLAFFVPVNWKPPRAEVNIVGPYPLFKDHAAYLYTNKPADQEPKASKEWFNTLVDPTKVSD